MKPFIDLKYTYYTKMVSYCKLKNSRSEISQKEIDIAVLKNKLN